MIVSFQFSVFDFSFLFCVIRFSFEHASCAHTQLEPNFYQTCCTSFFGIVYVNILVFGKNSHAYNLSIPRSLDYHLLCFDYWVVLCIVACPIPESGINTEPVPPSLNNSSAGTIYTYECSDCKYLPPADLFTICQSTGRWSLPPPTCEESMYLDVNKMGISLCMCMNIQLYFVIDSLLCLISQKNITFSQTVVVV